MKVLFFLGERVCLALWILTLTVGFFSNLTAQTPITLTGWNKDIIFENDGSPSISANFESDYTFAEHGLVVPEYDAYKGLATGVRVPVLGLPSSGNITSLAANTVFPVSTHSVFAISSYSTENVGFLQGTSVVTLTLPTPERFSSLAFLEAATTHQRVNVTLKFLDNTTGTFSFTSHDWRSEAGYGIPFGSGYPNPELPLPSGAATTRLDRVQNFGSSLPNRVFDQQRKWLISEADVDLTVLGFDQKAVKSITFEKFDSGNVAIFAISGSLAGSVLNEFIQNTDLAAPSNYNLNRLPTASADDLLLATTMGTALTINGVDLTIGSLNVTNGLDYSIQSGDGHRVLTMGSGHNANSTNGASANDLIRIGTGSNLSIVGVDGVSSLELALGRTGNFNVASTATLAISASISGAGFGINKTESGSVILTGVNTFSGSTVISTGRLEAAADGTLGQTNGIVINSGGTLLLSGVATDRVNDSSAVGVAGGGILLLNAGAQTTLEMLGQLTLTTGATIDFDSASSGGFVASFTSLVLANNVAPVTGYATIRNWNGAAIDLDTEPDRLLFTSNPGMISTEAIRFDIAGVLHSARFVEIDGLFELMPNQTLTPVPETATMLASILLLGLCVSERQRSMFPRRECRFEFTDPRATQSREGRKTGFKE